VYDAMQGVYTRVLISLERDAHPYVIGREKVHERGSTLGATVWVTNDLNDPIDPVDIDWEIAHVGTGEVAARHHVTAVVPADAAERVDTIAWDIPADLPGGRYRIAMRASEPDGRDLSTNATDITVR
jgi:hypothetical protein